MSSVTRFSWPKILPPLSAEQQAIADDFLRHWLTLVPRRFGAFTRFGHEYPLKFARAPCRTIEIGAGQGAHLEYENLAEQEYHCIEIRPTVADDLRARFPTTNVTVADCQERMPFPDDHFDRAIAIHVLEHLRDLPRAVAELHRLLRPGGILAIVIPCDPGLAYWLARKLTSEPLFRKRYGTDYRWFIEQEHVNSPAEVLSVLRTEFDEIDRTYFPLRIPIVSANLCIGLTYERSTTKNKVRAQFSM